MKGSQHPPPVGSGRVNPVTPLSVVDSLYPLAQTPAPTRFEKRRQRLEGKPRLPRVKRVARDAGTSTSTSTVVGSLQFDQGPRRATINAQPPLDAKDCERPSNNEPDGLTLEQTIRVARLAISNPAVDVNNRGEASKVTNGRYINTDHLQKQLPITPVEYPPLYGQQQCQESVGDNFMFVSTHSM